LGFDVEVAGGHAGLFGEAPSRVVACAASGRVAELTALAAGAGVEVTFLGRAGGDRLVVSAPGGARLVDLDLAEAEQGWRQALPATLQVAATSS
jgi:phosphoribosylformylglycinamidine synthase